MYPRSVIIGAEGSRAVGSLQKPTDDAKNKRKKEKKWIEGHWHRFKKKEKKKVHIMEEKTPMKEN